MPVTMQRERFGVMQHDTITENEKEMAVCMCYEAWLAWMSMIPEITLSMDEWSTIVDLHG